MAREVVIRVGLPWLKTEVPVLPFSILSFSPIRDVIAVSSIDDSLLFHDNRTALRAVDFVLPGGADLDTALTNSLDCTAGPLALGHRFIHRSTRDEEPELQHRRSVPRDLRDGMLVGFGGEGPVSKHGGVEELDEREFWVSVGGGP